MLISQDMAFVELYTKNEQGFWLLSDVSGLEGKLILNSIGVEISLSDIYDGIEFGEEE